MSLVQIVSGGQTGVDVAALRAARAVGLQTGGWMPCGFRMLIGPRPEYARLFGMREHRESAYPPRTSANVACLGATLRIAVNLTSAGERCTLEKIAKHRKPHLDVPFVYIGQDTPPTLATLGARENEIERVARWLVAGDWPTVNVAGNSERTAPGIEVYAQAFLEDVFRTVLRTHAALRHPGEPVF